MLPAPEIPLVVPATLLPPFPDGAWRHVFGAYRELVEGISECPLPFHFANLLAVIAAELGDKVRLAEGKATYTNFFLFCCGRTGTKKSTASDIVQEHITARLPAPLHTVFTSVSSAEGLCRALGQYSNILLCYDEIADLFATANRTGQRIEPELNKAFDLRKLQAVVKKATESLEVEDYCLSIMANGTPDHVRLQLSEAMFTGGLLNRFLVFAADPTGVSLPIMGTPNSIRAQAIATRIATLVAGWHKAAPHRGSVRIGFSPEAKEVHAEWYHRQTIAIAGMDDLQAKPLTRLDVYSKKLAAIYCLVESTPSAAPLLTAPQMRAALDVIAYCQASMLWVTSAWSGQKTIGQQAEKMAEDRVQGYLREHGCSTERLLYRFLHMGANECKRAVDALVSAGVVNVIMDRPRMVHFVERCRCFKG